MCSVPIVITLRHGPKSYQAAGETGEEVRKLATVPCGEQKERSSSHQTIGSRESFLEEIGLSGVFQ
jgi:hypothetical protein